MSRTVRLATFNCENLFQRTRILNLPDEAQSADLLAKVSVLQGLLGRKAYTDEIKRKIAEVSAGLREYVDLRVDAGSLGAWAKAPGGFEVYKGCAGRGSWSGELCFQAEAFGDVQRKNTGKVIAEAKADVVCAVEVEGLEVLRRFNTQVLKGRYAQHLSIDSYDPRGIDVGCLSAFPIVNVRTHIFDPFGGYDRVFSRDCLELALDTGGGVLNVLCNHFKSQRGKSKKEEDEAAAKRRAQAARVAEILGGYTLKKDLVAVMGDLNEDTDNPYQSLAPLLECPGLVPVVDPKLPAGERYTHYYAGGPKGKRLTQLDYIFVSAALAKKLKGFGFVRGGIFGADKEAKACGYAPVKTFPSVTQGSESASDHALLWAEFSL